MLMIAKILLTLTVAPVAVVLNVVFGVAAAWTIARFRFPGRTILTALVDLPFSVSPVVAGLMLWRPSWFGLKTVPLAYAAEPMLRAYVEEWSTPGFRDPAPGRLSGRPVAVIFRCTQMSPLEDGHGGPFTSRTPRPSLSYPDV